MKIFSDCGKRLEIVREHSKLSKQDFSQQIGFQLTSYYNLTNGNKNISIGILEAIKENFSWVNLHWLLTGEGEMRIGSEKINVVAEPQAEYKTALQLEQEKNKNLERLLAAKDEIISLLKNKS